MDWLAPALVALLFIVFGLSQRGRSAGSCSGCTGQGECAGKSSADCKRS